MRCRVRIRRASLPPFPARANLREHTHWMMRRPRVTNQNAFGCLRFDISQRIKGGPKRLASPEGPPLFRCTARFGFPFLGPYHSLAPLTAGCLCRLCSSGHSTEVLLLASVLTQVKRLSSLPGVRGMLEHRGPHKPRGIASCREDGENVRRWSLK